jgi:hypothetical protein
VYIGGLSLCLFVCNSFTGYLETVALKGEKNVEEERKEKERERRQVST